MINQEAFEAARAGDWIAQSFTRIGDVFQIEASTSGYSTFADCMTDGQSVFYAAFDRDDNREAGLAIWDADNFTLTPVEIHATLVGGKFMSGDPNPVPFINGGTITGTFNATAFNAMWQHLVVKGNPHETQAKDIDQDNSNLLGDDVQTALDKIANFILNGDIEGEIDLLLGAENLNDELKEALVFQDRVEPQKVVSEFTFHQAGDDPLSIKNTGVYADTAYVRYTGSEWEVSPSIKVTGSISTDGDLTIGGAIEGDLTVNGNIVIGNGGSVVDPDGNEPGLPEAPAGADQPYARDGETNAWVKSVAHADYTTDIGDINTSLAGKVDEEPQDGGLYLRQNGGWVELKAGNGLEIVNGEIRMTGSFTGAFVATDDVTAFGS